MKKYKMQWSKTSNGSVIVEAKNEKADLNLGKRGAGKVHIDKIELTIDTQPEEIKTVLTLDTDGWSLDGKNKFWQNIINGVYYQIDLTHEAPGKPQYRVNDRVDCEFHTLAEAKKCAEDMAEKGET